MVSKNIVALGFVSFFTDMASSMVTSVLPIYLVYVLHEGVDKLGFVVAIATFVSYMFRILFGYLSDRLQVVKPFVVTGYLISALTKPMLAMAGTWQQVAGLRGAERIGKAIRSASKDSLISAYSEGKRGRSFGFHKMMDVAGEVMGALIAFASLYFLGKNEAVFHQLFTWTLLPGLLAVIVALFFVRDAPYKRKQSTAFDWHDDLSLLPLLLIYFGFVFFLFSDSFFVIQAKESGVSMAYIPLLMVLYNGVQTASSYFFGIRIDHSSPEKVLLLAMVFGLGAMTALSQGWVIIGFVLLGLFTVSSLNAIRAWISQKAHNQATIYGIFYAGIALFGALGAMTTGLIWKHYGEHTAILFSLIGLTLMLGLYGYYCLRQKETHA